MKAQISLASENKDQRFSFGLMQTHFNKSKINTTILLAHADNHMWFPAQLVWLEYQAETMAAPSISGGNHYFKSFTLKLLVL